MNCPVKVRLKSNLGQFKSLQFKISSASILVPVTPLRDVVRNLIKSTKFEEYNVNVKKGEICQMITEEELERNNLLVEIAKKINNELSNAYPNKIDGGVVMRISPPEAPQELIVEVSTLLDGKNKKLLVRK